MNREIKFRGYSEEYKKWIYGDLVQYGVYKSIRLDIGNELPKYTERIVNPKSVGQLRYKNKYGEYYDGDIYYHAGYGLIEVSDLCELQEALLSGNSDDIGEIKGNVHENKELLTDK